MSGRGFNLNDYATVDERITRYWEMHPKPEGSIQTEVIWVSNDGNSVAIRATVYQGERILATGIAQEERGGKGANTTSWWENAETSAIGRALANMDMSLSKNRPSRQEMEKSGRYEADATPPPARESRADPHSSTSKAGAAPTAPAPPYTKEEYEAAIKTAWAMEKAGDAYPVIVAYMKTHRNRLTDDQMEDSREEMRLIKAAMFPDMAAVS